MAKAPNDQANAGVDKTNADATAQQSNQANAGAQKDGDKTDATQQQQPIADVAKDSATDTQSSTDMEEPKERPRIDEMLGAEAKAAFERGDHATHAALENLRAHFGNLGAHLKNFNATVSEDIQDLIDSLRKVL